MGRELIALAVILATSACGGPRPIASAPPAREAPPESDVVADRVRVRVIRVLFAERDPAAARERAAMLARTARADDFSALAREHGDGEEPRRSELGAAGLEITADAPAIVPRAVRDAALRLEPHEVSRAIEAEDGLWVLQRIE